MAPPRPTGTRPCDICGTEFERKSWQQRLCTDPACKRKAKSIQQTEWNRQHPEKHQPKAAAWRKRNPDRNRAYVAIRQGRKRAGQYGVEHVPYTVDQLLELLPRGCAICREDTGATIGWDHIVALVNGGTDRIENIQPAHELCNRRKSTLEAPAS